MITIKLSKNNSLTHLDKNLKEKEYLESLGLELRFTPYNDLCNYVSEVSINQSLTYELEEKLHKAYCESGNKFYFDSQKLISIIKRLLHRELVSVSRELSSHEVTGVNHIRTNPGGKVFSRSMDEWGNIIFEENKTYQQLVNEIVDKVNQYFKEYDLLIES